MVKKKNIQKIFSYVLILTLIIPLVFGGSVKVVQAASAASKAKAAYSAYLKKQYLGVIHQVCSQAILVLDLLILIMTGFRNYISGRIYGEKIMIINYMDI